MEATMSKTAYWGTSGAGVLAVAEDTGRFLVALRGKDTREPGTWGTIGGRRDPGDKTLKDTALREFREETGYEGDIDLVPVLDFEDPGRFKYRNFVGVLPQEPEDLEGNDENEVLLWATYEELMALDPKHPGLAVLLDSAADALKDFIKKDEPELE
jgi:8-oxo-dGTP pyrophosphatase MutT (NUDIX family)